MVNDNETKEQTMQVVMNQLYDAYNYFNKYLFSKTLPEVNINIGVKKGAKGAFYVSKYKPKSNNDNADDRPPLDEILINPTCFDRKETDVLSTLVHEMVHLYEQHFGTPGKGTYHNKSWARSMKGVGLYPSSTGEPGGQEIGHKMTHYIVPDGPFDRESTKWLSKTGFTIEFLVLEKISRSATHRKVKYICACENGKPIWASNSGMEVSCNICGDDFEEVS